MNESRAKVSYLLAPLVLSLGLLLALSILLAGNAPVVANTDTNEHKAIAIDSDRTKISDTLTITVYLPLIVRFVSLPLPNAPTLKPPANDYAAPITSTISITYNQYIDPATVNGQTFVVHGTQTGLLMGAYSVNESTIIMTPTHAFRHGDEIVVTLSDAILDTDGAPLIPYAWRFRTVVVPPIVGGTGHLEPHPTTPHFGSGDSQDVALGDLDGDGDLDVFLAHRDGFPSTAPVWINDGLGNFGPHPNTFDTGDSTAVALGDLDGDGDLDVVAANMSSAPQTVWLNDGQGTFTPHPTVPSFGDGTLSRDIVLGDLDGDGDPDAIVASSDAPQTVWLNGGQGTLNYGNGAFSPHPTTPSFGVGNSYGLSLGDLDGDGDLDVVVANSDAPQTVWLNDGAGNFSPHPDTPTFGSDYGSAITLGDLDGDQDLDAIVSHGSGRDSATWLNDGEGNFSPHQTSPNFEGQYSSEAVSLGDLDGDGDLDTVVASCCQFTETVWLNDGEGNFNPQPTTPQFEAGPSEAVALGDLDGDGDLDAVVANSNAPQTIWLNQNPNRADLELLKTAPDRFPDPGDTVTHTVIVNNTGPSTATGVLITDSRSTGVTFVSANASQGTYSSTTGTGSLNPVTGIWSLGALPAGRSETLTITVAVTLSSGAIVNTAEIVTSDQFDPDSAPGNNVASEDDQDSVTLCINPFSVVTTKPAGNGQVISQNGIVSATFERAISMTTVTTATFTARGAQTGIYAGAYTLPVQNQAQFAPVGSFKPGEEIVTTLNDGVRATDGTALIPHTWEFHAAVDGGTGNLIPHPTTPSFQEAGVYLGDTLALGDLDSDGDLDVMAVSNWAEGSESVWLNDGAGNLSPHSEMPTFSVGGSTDVVLGDLDNDGDLDAVIANWNNEPQTVWLNDGVGTFGVHPTNPKFGAGISDGLALGDLDGDGDLDVIVANRNNEPQTVWLNRGAGNFTIHPTTPTFGAGDSRGVSLGDLDGDGDLDAVIANSGNEPQTIWLNDGLGNLSAHPTTPAIGAGYSTDIALGDLDNDGDLDAVVVNSVGPEETVWMNDGLGNFSAHSTIPSFDAGSEDIAIGDLDGDGDLDAVFANTSGHANTIWVNDGMGNFSPHPVTPGVGSGFSVAAALGDLDRDGDLDAVFGNDEEFNTVWLNQD